MGERETRVEQEETEEKLTRRDGKTEESIWKEEGVLTGAESADGK